MPSTTNFEEEETFDAPGNDGNASMPEQVKRPNPRRKMMMTFVNLNRLPDVITQKIVMFMNNAMTTLQM
jgi:hypothetical protein